jgi:hypothetical protein
MTALTALFITVISIAMTVYWIVAIVEVARIPGWQFDAAGASKTPGLAARLGRRGSLRRSDVQNRA